MQPAIRSTTASAPGKVILCGEHAVVYGQPAIALPLSDLRATATIDDGGDDSITVALPDLGETWRIDDSPDHPLTTLLRLTLDRIGESRRRGLQITLRSAIPIASGMGSGAALGAALVKAVAAHLGRSLDPGTVSRLVYESERFYHGTPSGIDNTVVSYEQAISFVRGREENGVRRPPTIEPLRIAAPFALVIGDTGVRAPTHIMVGALRQRWQQDRSRFDRLFNEIGQLVGMIRQDLASGDLQSLGAALSQNHALLREIGVSAPELEGLIEAALAAGALGAKLVEVEQQALVARSLLETGAARVIQTVVGCSDSRFLLH
jgi:mevalonate kinase